MPTEILTLDPRFRWRSLCVTHAGLSAVGHAPRSPDTSSDLALQQITAGATAEPVPWPALPPDASSVAGLAVGDMAHLLVWHFPGTDSAAWLDPDGSHVAIPAIAVAKERDEFLVLCVKETGSLVIDAHGPDGSFRRSDMVDIDMPDIRGPGWLLGACGDDRWMIGPPAACCMNFHESRFLVVGLHDVPTSLSVAPHPRGSQAVIVCGREVLLVAPSRQAGRMESVNLWASASPHTPVACFTHHGAIVIADSMGGVLYAARDGNVVKETDLAVPAGTGPLIAAAPLGSRGWAFLTADGRTLVFA